MNNLERFRSDLTALIKEGDKLFLKLQIKIRGIDEIAESLKLNEEQKLAWIKLPSFNLSYETWYSECVSVIRQLLPDRLQDFREHFEVPKNRKEISVASYRIQDALNGLRVTKGPFGETAVDVSASVSHFDQQRAILKAAERRFESSLFEIRQLVQADLFDTEIDSARQLLKNKFVRAAGAIAGVVLEKHLYQVCDNHKVKLSKKNSSISELNEILKKNSVIDVPQWRHISMLGDLRNLCSHQKQNDPTELQVVDLIDGTEKVIKTIF